MTGPPDAEVVRDIDRLLNIFARVGLRNIQLVITKWDAVPNPDGSLCTIRQVQQKLDSDSPAFRALRLNSRQDINVRMIRSPRLGWSSLPQPRMAA